MMRRELGDTLIALVAALTPSVASGLVVTAAELDVPLEVASHVENGRLVFYADAPHSRWQTGFLPPTHLSHIVVALVEDSAPDDYP